MAKIEAELPEVEFLKEIVLALCLSCNVSPQKLVHEMNNNSKKIKYVKELLNRIKGDYNEK